MDRVFPMSRKVNKVVSPFLGRMAGLPVPGDEVFGSASKFYDRLDGVRELLTDTALTSVRLVVNPERLVVAEARRTYTYLSLFGYRVDAVVANRLLPEAITDPWFQEWKARHAEHLSSIEDGFAPLPILRAELASDELVGVEALRGFGKLLYADLDPSAVLHPGEPLQVARKGTGYELLGRAAVRRQGRARARSPRRRAADPGRLPSAGAAAAGLVAPTRGPCRLPARRQAPGHVRGRRRRGRWRGRGRAADVASGGTTRSARSSRRAR